MVILSGITGFKSFAQTGLYVSSVISNPSCFAPDTAHESVTYNLTFTVTNMSAGTIVNADTLYIMFRNDSLAQPIEEVVAQIGVDSIAFLDTINLTTSYQFTQNKYKSGGNIVVVWPRVSNTSSVLIDSIRVNVIFEPLAGLNMLHVQNEGFAVFPNPAKDEIQWILQSKNDIEYVRILNDTGQEVLNGNTKKNLVDIKFLSQGFYFMELKTLSGSIARKKFLKL